jgi:hypothetical protein
MISYLVLDYNRPVESELCLRSLLRYSRFDYEIVYLSNGGDQDYVIDYYKQGLIDKLILRKENSGCGLGTRELFNNFNLAYDYVIYVQCDQFLCREFTRKEIQEHIENLNSGEFFYVDLAGNQGHGNYSERAHLINKHKYNLIPNTIGGPGPFADKLWTEESVQRYIKNNNLKFYSSKLLFMDNGKVSRREYPCGGILTQHTDEKSVFIEKPIANRIDFPNVKLNDQEWELILTNKWVNGTIPEGHKNDSFKCWNGIYSLSK